MAFHGTHHTWESLTGKTNYLIACIRFLGLYRSDIVAFLRCWNGGTDFGGNVILCFVHEFHNSHYPPYRNSMKYSALNGHLKLLRRNTRLVHCAHSFYVPWSNLWTDCCCGDRWCCCSLLTNMLRGSRIEYSLSCYQITMTICLTIRMYSTFPSLKPRSLLLIKMSNHRYVQKSIWSCRNNTAACDTWNEGLKGITTQHPSPVPTLKIPNVFLYPSTA